MKWKVVPSTDLVEQIEIAMTLLGRFKYRIESVNFSCEKSDFCRSYQHKRSARCEAPWGKKIWLPTHRINFGSHVTVRPRYCREGEPWWPAETAQKGLETKWEGLVTILSLVSNLPKKVISKKSFGRPPSKTQAYHCQITQSTAVAAQCNSRSSIQAATWGCSLGQQFITEKVVVNSIYFYRERLCCAIYSRLRYSILQIFLKGATLKSAIFKTNGPLIFKRKLLSFSIFWKSTSFFILAFVTSNFY